MNLLPAARDIRDLRSMLDLLRLVRRTAVQTVVRAVTTANLLALLVGVAIKLRFCDGGHVRPSPGRNGINHMTARDGQERVIAPALVDARCVNSTVTFNCHRGVNSNCYLVDA